MAKFVASNHPQSFQFMTTLQIHNRDETNLFLWSFIQITNLHINLSVLYVKQGNSVTRDLPPTGSEANTTILFNSHCPYLLSGENTFQLTSY